MPPPEGVYRLPNPQATIRNPPSRPGRWRRWASLLITVATIGLILLFNELASSKLAWWKDVQFAGRVVAKEARDAKTGAVADPAVAATDKNAPRYRFFLTIDTVDGLVEYRVSLRVFQHAQTGWTLVKRTGTFEATLTPPAEEARP